MEDNGAFGMDITNLGLVSSIRIPPKFKVPNFEKYKGTLCPKTHVRAYYRKISAYTSVEKLLMQFSKIACLGHHCNGI